MCEWSELLSERFEPLMSQALPRMAPIVASLKPVQLERLRERYDVGNTKFREEFIEPKAAERERASIQRAIERAERLYGRLDAPQRAVVAEVVRAAPFDAEAWDIERRARQQAVLETMRGLQAQRADAQQTLLALRALGERMRSSGSADAQASQQRITQTNCAFAARIHNSTNAAQRAKARERLLGWRADALALSAVPKTLAQSP
jgi:hypothetical protein